MTEPKDIETQIKERQELLEEISVWPWKPYWIHEEDEVMYSGFHDNNDQPINVGEEIENYEENNLDFIATSPQFESDLIKEYQKLKKQNEIMREALERYAESDNWLYDDDDLEILFDIDKGDQGYTVAQEALKQCKEI